MLDPCTASERSLNLSDHVARRTLQLLAERVAGEPARTVVYNPLG